MLELQTIRKMHHSSQSTVLLPWYFGIIMLIATAEPSTVKEMALALIVLKQRILA